MFWFTIFFFFFFFFGGGGGGVQYKEHKVCLTKIQHRVSTVGYIMYFQNTCIVRDMQILDVKIGALICFLNGFGIAVPVFSY